MTVDPVALLALVTAAISLTFQVVTWIRSGPRIVVWFREIHFANDQRNACEIVVINDGRMAVTVREVELRARPRFRPWKRGTPVEPMLGWGGALGPLGSAELPAVVAPGESVTVYGDVFRLEEYGPTRVRVRTWLWIFLRDTRTVGPKLEPIAWIGSRRKKGRQVGYRYATFKEDPYRPVRPELLDDAT